MENGHANNGFFLGFFEGSARFRVTGARAAPPFCLWLGLVEIRLNRTARRTLVSGSARDYAKTQRAARAAA